MSNEETYKCPKCGCEFVRREGEDKVCRCSKCGTTMEAEKASQHEQHKKESDHSCCSCDG